MESTADNLKNGGEPRVPTQHPMEERGALGIRYRRDPWATEDHLGTSGETGGANDKTAGLPNPLHKGGRCGVNKDSTHARVFCNFTWGVTTSHFHLSTAQVYMIRCMFLLYNIALKGMCFLP